MSEEEILFLLGEASGPDTGEPTPEMAREIAALMKDNSLFLLAVRAWDRGQSFKKAKADLDRAREELERVRAATPKEIAAEMDGERLRECIALRESLSAAVGLLERLRKGPLSAHDCDDTGRCGPDCPTCDITTFLASRKGDARGEESK